MYAYCGNDPINHVDPDGLFFKKLFGWIGKGIASVVKAAVKVAVKVLASKWGQLIIGIGLALLATPMFGYMAFGLLAEGAAAAVISATTAALIQTGVLAAGAVARHV